MGLPRHHKRSKEMKALVLLFSFLLFTSSVTAGWGDTDSDGDGQVDAADEDDDNDGLLDVEDDDDDGDGVQDEDEDNDGDGLTNDGIVFKFVLHLPWILWCNLFKFKR